MNFNFEEGRWHNDTFEWKYKCRRIRVFVQFCICVYLQADASKIVLTGWDGDRKITVSWSKTDVYYVICIIVFVYLCLCILACYKNRCKCKCQCWLSNDNQATPEAARSQLLVYLCLCVFVYLYLLAVSTSASAGCSDRKSAVEQSWWWLHWQAGSSQGSKQLEATCLGQSDLLIATIRGPSAIRVPYMYHKWTEYHAWYHTSTIRGPSVPAALFVL